MKIGTKCNFNKEELLCAVKKGLPYVEFHTNITDFDGTIDFKEIKKILKDHNVTCHAVHAPLTDSKGDCEAITIGTLVKESREFNISLFKKCIELANYLCDTKHPIVVTHIGTRYVLSDKTMNKLSKKYIEKTLKEAKEDLNILNTFIEENYPNTTLVVENMPNMAYTKDTIEPCSWYFGTREDLPLFIESLNLPNIKTCLDVCHLTTTMRIDKIINPYSTKTLSDYIDDFSSTLKLVHLNNCINLGEITNYHSQPFNIKSKSDLDMLVEFFYSIKRNNIDCFISLEINQTNYYTQENTDITIECVKKALEIVGEKISF